LIRKWSPILVLGVALAGCNSGDSLSKGDQVKPELPRVTIEIDGMT
jgi:hypothetical protein